MIIGESKLQTWFWRKRNGKAHKCFTSRTLYLIRCDNCEQEFTRTSKQINRSSAAHVCSKCDSKRFAQKQSSILRKFNKWDASSSKTI